MQLVTVGSLVHYVLTGGRSQGEHRPAIVVRVWGEHLPDTVPPKIQLQVFTDATNDYQPEQVGSHGLLWATSVTQDEETKVAGTWHWPEE